MVTFAKFIFRICLFTFCWNHCVLKAFAQIVPDRTLGSENSVVRSDLVKGAIADYIEGGAIRDKNLFHSFSEFNLNATDRAYFAVPTGVENILTRVTGTDVSHIRGTLGVDGGANLFLLNPKGIIFDRQAQLDIQGSFLATTADSYIFREDLDFSAIDPQPPLLAINIPIGLQFGGAPGAIVNNSRTETAIAIPEGLRAGKGQTLSLLGGEITSAGGYLNTVEGRIELGAVAGGSKLKLNPSDRGWIVDYDGVEEFADLKISENGGIDGGNTGNAEIVLKGKNISLGYNWDSAQLDLKQSDFSPSKPLIVLDELAPDRVQIAADNQDNSIPSTIEIEASHTLSIIDPSNQQQNILAHTSGTGDAGAINLTADRIIIYGASLESWTLAEATGDSGAIDLTANNLAIQYGGGGVNTFSEGAGGTISLNIAEDIAIASGGFGAEARDIGAGGTVEIAANNLKIVSGGIGTGTFASGKGGTIDLKIADNLTIDTGGFGADAKGSGDGGSIKIEAKNIQFLSAGIGVNTWGSGLGGKIVINAETMMFKDGVIGAESGQNIDLRDFVADDAPEEFGGRNAGDGGDIQITAKNLSIDNANITTSTFGTGNAGNLSFKVNSITAVGGDLITGINSFTDGRGTGGNIEIIGDRLEVSQEATIAANSSNIGRAGDITIDIKNLLQLDSSGTISVDGGEVGLPGNINIKSEDLRLRQGKISATTNQGIQGNIRLSGEQLLLRDRSQIITNAGLDATGGNISIDLKYNLLGTDNSEITASAEKGQGGNIQINTKGIFFTQDSSINANSQSGADGTTKVSTLVDDRLDSDLIQLPNKPTQQQQKLALSCSSNSNNRFLSVGRGGLPENPLKGISNNSLLADLDAFTVEEARQEIDALESIPALIVEAEILSINATGNLELIALSNFTRLQKQLDCLK